MLFSLNESVKVWAEIGPKPLFGMFNYMNFHYFSCIELTKGASA